MTAPCPVLKLSAALLIPIAISAAAEPAAADNSRWLQPTLVYETGPAYVAQNDGQYGASGTRYDADDVAQQENLARASRTSLELAIDRHTLILMYAPFELRTQAMLDRDLNFRDEVFTTGTVVDHRYLFDGYRASYLYRILDGDLALELGGSLQIRNAEVAFTSTSGLQRADEDDIGLVFAAKARLWWRPANDRLWGALEADGFSTFGLVPGVRGAIYDVNLMLGYSVTNTFDLMLGARLLGGGATVESRDIYNWANFVAATVGVRVALDGLFDGS